MRWIAFIRESQLSSDTICQFIVNFCIDFSPRQFQTQDS
ncbi:transcriptional regulator VpsR [Vibrio maritimus]|uniref:Transcriptional regulator VpsR n=1 Tax=Vibrio maritimus TaxID=990268 RepID=A0A090TNG6_9VIBR|nr:transcriptional regulator VpsR [Vibrio maritimus]